MDKDTDLWDGKSFADIMKDIYTNQKKKEKQITTLISELQPLIQNISDATIIVPLIKEYLEISVKNDDHLVKLAAVVQRLINSSTKGTHGGNSMEGDFVISEDEKRQLMTEAQAEMDKLAELEQKLVDTNDKAGDITNVGN